MDDLGETISWVKVGLQLFTAEGPPIVHAMRTRGLKVFLDLKFHDIPHTAREAVRSAVALGAGMATIHLSGGSHMVRSAVEASETRLYSSSVSPCLRAWTMINSTRSASDELRKSKCWNLSRSAEGVVCAASFAVHWSRSLAKQVWQLADDRHPRSAAIGC